MACDADMLPKRRAGFAAVAGILLFLLLLWCARNLWSARFAGYALGLVAWLAITILCACGAVLAFDQVRKSPRYGRGRAAVCGAALACALLAVLAGGRTLAFAQDATSLDEASVVELSDAAVYRADEGYVIAGRAADGTERQFRIDRALYQEGLGFAGDELVAQVAYLPHSGVVMDVVYLGADA